MARKLKILFMGTPDFAVASLKAIIKAKYEVVGVVTAPDKPAGRGRKIKTSSVKEFAKHQGIKILQPTSLKSETFIKEIRSLGANAYVVVAFRMLPKVVWELPAYGTFNLHASLLPDYRGAAPINWAIINGEEKTGVTTFFINEKIDNGEIILQKEVPIEANETFGELHDKLMNIGSNLIVETLKSIEQERIKPLKQPTTPQSKPAPKIFTETCKINWKQDAKKIYDFIRGLNPFPGAWTQLLIESEQPIKLKIYNTKLTLEKHIYEIGTIFLDKKKMRIYAEGGFLDIKTLQVEGKKQLQVYEFLNGFNLNKRLNVL